MEKKENCEFQHVLADWAILIFIFGHTIYLYWIDKTWMLGWLSAVKHQRGIQIKAEQFVIN